MRRSAVRGARAAFRYASSREVREADRFWETLVGRPARSAPVFRRGLPAATPMEAGAALESAFEFALPEWAAVEAVPAGPTASPIDIARTSETLDRFALDSAALTPAHRTTIGALAASLLSGRGGSRPIRVVDILGFTDPSGGATYNRALGRRRAQAVRDALVTELNRRSAGAAASFTFRVRSAGEAQQVPGGAAANRRVEVFVRVSVTNVAVHASDHDTHEIASNVGAAGLEHFCCVKGTGDIVLHAEISPDVPGATGTRLAWEATGATITSPAVGGDGRTAKLSSAASGKFPIQIKWDGAAVRQAVVWVIWSKVQVTATSGPNSVADPAGLQITMRIDHSFTIEPAAIITDADRPALDGARTSAVPGAAQAHLISGNLLAGGATTKWDASRQIQMKVLNPRLFPVAQLPPVAGHLWTGQPAASTVPENYPANDALGNDDSHVSDEHNDPYAQGGVVTAWDTPSMWMANATGADGDTFEMHYQFHEFLRVNLDTAWYRASDFSPWRFHPRFRRTAGAWTNDASVLARDNNGF